MYFFFKKRIGFDFLSLMFLSTTFYFLPILFGFVTKKENSKFYYIMINEKTYQIATVLFLCITLIGIVYDKFLKNKLKYKIGKSTIDRDFNKFIVVLFIFISIIFFLTKGYSMIGKTRELANMVGIYKIWSNMILVLGGVSVVSRYRFGIVVALAGGLFDLYLGDRTMFVILLIILVIQYLINNCRQNLFFYKKIFIVLLISISPLLLYKRIIGPIQRGDISELTTRLTTIETYTESIVSIEPFTIQCILNEVLSKNYKVKENTISSISNLNPFGEKIQYKTFNEQMQDDLFPAVKYGMGSNIWAEIYSNSTLAIVFVASFLYACIGGGVSILYRVCNSKILKSIILVNATMFIFYIHRNALTYQINLNLRLIYLYISILILYMLVKKINVIRRYIYYVKREKK